MKTEADTSFGLTYAPSMRLQDPALKEGRGQGQEHGVAQGDIRCRYVGAEVFDGPSPGNIEHRRSVSAEYQDSLFTAGRLTTSCGIPRSAATRPADSISRRCLCP